MRLLKAVLNMILAVPRFLFADLPRSLFFIMSLPVIFAGLLVIAFSTDLLDPFLYKDLKDQDAPGKDFEEEIVYLDQGWQQGYRQKFYFTPQGSQIIPLDIALALEGPDTKQLIFGPDGLAHRRYGFLPYPSTKGLDPKDPDGPNPLGLPVGFTVDPDRQGREMLGMSCAACHTTDITIRDKKIRIDGGSALIDFMAFIEAMDKGLAQTLDDPAKFARMAGRLGADSEEKKAALKNRLGVTAAKRQAWQRRNATDYDHGPARVDAFNIIFNQVVGKDIGLDTKDAHGNVNTPDAPVSFPVLWDSPFMGRVQYTGGSNNKKPGDPLGRNFGQVLGVFGDSEVATQSTLPGYCSTVRRKNVELYHFWLKSLNSPQWEDPALKSVLPALDPERVKRGKAIYMGEGRRHSCVSCHGVQPEDWRERAFTEKAVCEAPMKMIDHKIVQTDAKLIETGKRKGAKTGPLAGMPSKLNNGKPVRAEEDYMFVLGEVIAGSIVGSYLSVSCDGHVGASTLIETASTFGGITNKKHRFSKKVGGGVSLEGGKPSLECDGAEPYSFNTYKARALNGIWASAPYLHNGSVPTLYDMLLPPSDRENGCASGDCRPDRFYVGSSSFDPVKVGFDSSGATGGKVFDTSIPGNLNTGHMFGVSLSEEEKLDLIEYLKSL